MPQEAVIAKRLCRELSLRRRHQRLTVDQLVKSELLEKFLFVLAVKLRRAKDNKDEDAHERYLQAFRVGIAGYIQERYVVEMPLPALLHLRRNIDSFSESDCYIFFRFTRPHLYQLVALLGLRGETVVFSNRQKMSGEEVLLRGLYELASGETKHKIAANVFGGDDTTQSRAFKYFVNYLRDNYCHLLTDNLNWWYDNGFFEQSALAIGRKLDLEDVPEGMNMVSHFIDCNCLETDRVGGGPAENGANAARWDPDIQRSFYNGWKSMDGLKHQTVDDAYGFTIHCFGPTSLRRNDLALLRESDINFYFARLQLLSDDDFVIFGDSAYKRQTHLRSYFHRDEVFLDWDTARWNRHMKRLRISIEWNYGRQAELFKYLTTEFKMKVLQSDSVAKVFMVTALLRNLHNGFYGSQTSRYFDLIIPEDFNYKYVNQLPL